ncbi:MAG: PAN domain-containing protein [Henriciella sp.]|jgi:hypothetical protein|nr:PAN domain-containing protein [Henriciella sp.]
MRILSALAAIAMIASPAFAEHHSKVTKVNTVPADTRLAGHEPDTYRFGYPYNSMRGTTPGQCEQMCNRDQSCASWSYVPATFQIGPRCELKRSVGSQSYRPGAVSGIAKQYQPRPQSAPRTAVTQAAPTVTRRETYRPAPQSAPRPVRSQSVRSTAPKPMAGLLGGPTVITTGQGANGRVIRPSGAMPANAPKIYPSPAPAPAPVAMPAPRPTMTTIPNAVTRRPAPVAKPQPAPVQPTPRAPVPQFEMVPEQAAAPAPRPAPQPAPVASAPVEATAPMSSGGVSIEPAAPIPNRRKPWTERSNGDPDYSVGDSGFIPGDEEATAGLIDGLPEADEE